MSILAVDTESEGSRLWSVQWSREPGKAWMWLRDSGEPLPIREELGDPSTLVVLHNAPFDLRMLRQAGVRPPKYTDTMVMAYLLGMDAIGLKTLAYRMAGMVMDDYEDVVRPATERKAGEYLRAVLEREWPDPEPEIQIKPDGSQHVKWGQNLRRRLGSYLKKLEKGTAKLTPYKYWTHKDREADREMVELVLGELQEGFLSEIPLSESVPYGCRDADATGRIYHSLKAQIQELGLEDTLNRDMGIVEMVVDMMDTGILLDMDWFEALRIMFEDDAQTTMVRIEALAGRYVNPNSSKQVGEMLMEMGHPVNSTGSEELDRLRDVPVVAAIQDYRQVQKLLGTYVVKMPRMVDGEGRIHTDLSMTRTETGRLASSKPNLQNIPMRTKQGRLIRQGFVAQPGCRLVSGDLSQIEMRLAAHMSQDPYMMQIFLDGLDIHTMTAARAYRKDPADVDPKTERYPMKRTGFGVLYGITAAGLLDVFTHEGVVGYTERDCERFIADWFATFPRVKEWERDVEAEARRTGMVRDMFGRVRYVPEVYSALPFVREAGLRQAVNAPIQCIPSYVRVRTIRGYEQIGSLLGKDFVVWTGSEWATARALHKGKGELVRVKLDNGFVFTCDTAHKLLVQRTAWPEWIGVLELEKGDVLTTGMPDAFDAGEVVETPEYWYWVGRYYGDGHLFHLKRGDVHPRKNTVMKNSRQKVDWYFGGCKVEEYGRLVTFLKETGHKVCVSIDVRHKGHKGVARVSSTTFDKSMLGYGITPNQTSWEKRVADVVFTLDVDRKKAFIQGYFDADGTRPKKYPNGLSAYAITSVNYPLLQDTYIIARSVGILSNIRGPYSQKRGSCRDFYRLNLHTGDKQTSVVCVEATGITEDVFTLSVDNEHHSFDSEGVISKNSGAQGIIKQIMADSTPVYREWQEAGFIIKPLLQIHDEILWEIQEDILEVVIPQLHRVMVEAVTLTVPVEADFEVGDNWLEQEGWDWGKGEVA